MLDEFWKINHFQKRKKMVCGLLNFFSNDIFKMGIGLSRKCQPMTIFFIFIYLLFFYIFFYSWSILPFRSMSTDTFLTIEDDNKKIIKVLNIILNVGFFL